MRQALQLITVPAPPPAPVLPLLATPNDVRSVVHYLKKCPAGVTLDEAADAVKRQTFEPQKLAAYEALGLTRQAHGRLQLDTLGHELARSLEPGLVAFRALLERITPYRAVLHWASEQSLECLLCRDVAGYWRSYYPEALGLCDEKAGEGYTACFFQIAQAAALGTYIPGRKGQPTRLRLDSAELREFVTGEPQPAPPGVTTFPERRAEPMLTPRPVTRPRLFIAHRGRRELAEDIAAALELADIATVISARATTAGAPLAPATLKALRGCTAGLFILTPEDLTDAQVSLEVGAAFALYERRVILLSERGLSLPDNWRALTGFTYDCRGLTWDTGLKLLKAVKEMLSDRVSGAGC